MDRKGGNPKRWNKAINELERLKQNWDLIDIWRVKNLNNREYTWRRKRPIIQSRIDYWLISDSLQNYIQGTEIVPGILSDHSAIKLHVKMIVDPQPGRGLWKINNSVLLEHDYQTLIVKTITDVKQQNNELSARVKWDLIKYYIRKETMQYCKERARKQKKHKEDLELNIKDLEKTVGMTPSEENYNKLQQTKRLLKNILEEEQRWLILKSRVTDYELVEKCTKYFLQQLKYNHKKCHVISLKSNDGNIETDANLILRRLYTYYQELYKAKPAQPITQDSDREIVRGIENVTTSKCLSSENADLCEGDVTSEELYQILKAIRFRLTKLITQEL
jgi:hypothetical protein